MDTEQLKAEMRQREEKWKAEASDVGRKYKALLEEVRGAEIMRKGVKDLQEENKKTTKEVEQAWQDDIDKLKGEVKRSLVETDDAKIMAK